MPFDIGDSVPIAWDVKNAAGTLVNAGSVVLTITLPDGTTTTPSVAVPSVTGQYRETYVPAVAGRFAWNVVTQNPNTAIGGVFVARETPSPALLSLDDAKAHLEIPTIDTARDEELREFLEAATELIEDYVGPIVRRTHTVRVNGGGQAILLPHTQVLEVTALTLVRDGSTPILLADLAVDTDAGVVTRKDGGYFPYGPYDATYEVGRSYVKPNWTLAAKMIVKNQWGSKLGNLPSIQGDDVEYQPGVGGPLIPPRAMALLRPDEVPIGFA